MAGLSGDESPMPPNSHNRNGDHADGIVNGDLGISGTPSGELTSELRNLVSILGRQSDNGISLEQLLSGTSTSPTRSCVTPSPALSHQIPTTPSSSRSTNWTGRKRGRPFEPEDSSKRRRVTNSAYSARQSGEKGHGKGLRHFSQRVCEKVRQKGNTTYNEVADELVKELSESERKVHGSNDVPIDHKNIRRRVYDALNVLMAMNIISKEKKDIRWIGLPTNSVQECHHIEEEVSQAEQRVQAKRSKVEDLIVQILSYKNLMKRNRERVSSLGAPAQNSAIGLPFIIVNTSKSTTIDCSISSDKSEYVFSFDNAFELHNDIDILKKMGLDCGVHSGSCSTESLKAAKSMLPKAFGDTLDDIVLSKNFPAVAGSPPHLPPSSLCSTPNTTNTTLSPLHTPFTTPTASSPHVAAIAAVLAHASGAGLQHSPHGVSPMNNRQRHNHHQASPIRSTPTLLPNNISYTSCSTPPSGANPPPLSAISSPSTPLFADTTPINNGTTATTGRGKTVPIAAKTSLSPILGAKAVLHHHCPLNQPESTSPLVKSSMSNAHNAIQTASPVHGSSSLIVSKSPSAKFVTASKVASNEHFNNLLQQLQQNPNISRLLSAAALHSNGNGTS